MIGILPILTGVFLAAASSSGAEAVENFQAQCLDPFPSMDAIAAVANERGFEEWAQSKHDVFGEGAPIQIPKEFAASITFFDSRSFQAPIGKSGMPMIVAMSFRQTVDGKETNNFNCVMNFSKADEAQGRLTESIDNLSYALSARFGFPFDAKRNDTLVAEGLVAGTVVWQPTNDVLSEISLKLHFTEFEPRVDRTASSTWLLMLYRSEARQ